MPLHVRDERALELARRLAERRGVTLTRAVIDALEGELKRETGKQPLEARLDAIATNLAARGNPRARRRPGKVEIDSLWGND